MPVIKSAIKKLRQDKKRTAVNKKIIQQLNSAIKGVKKSKKVSISEAYSKIDKASKKGLIHSNKAARLKSQMSKLIKPAAKKSAVKKPSKTAAKTKITRKTKKVK